MWIAGTCLCAPRAGGPSAGTRHRTAAGWPKGRASETASRSWRSRSARCGGLKFQILWACSLSDQNLFIIPLSGRGFLTEAGSLQFDGRSHLFELRLDRLGLFLGHFLLDRLGHGIHQVLGLFQAEARDLPDDLDGIDLLIAR